LARLDLSKEELERMTGQLDNILNYIEKLNEVETEKVVPTTHVFAITNALREDLITPSLKKEDVLANAPGKTEDQFVVPKII